jgi:hypothetical protein
MAGAGRRPQATDAAMEPTGGCRDTDAMLSGSVLGDRHFSFGLLMAIFAISGLLLLPGVAVGRIAARGGSQRDGDMAMAIFATYVIGQFMPLFY